MAVILQAEGTVGRFYLPKEVETVLINKAYKFRICPTKKQEILLPKQSDAAVSFSTIFFEAIHADIVFEEPENDVNGFMLRIVSR